MDSKQQYIQVLYYFVVMTKLIFALPGADLGGNPCVFGNIVTVFFYRNDKICL